MQKNLIACYEARHKNVIAARWTRHVVADSLTGVARTAGAIEGDRYQWKVQPGEVFRRSAEELYKVLATKSRTANSVNSLGSDGELWTQAVNIVLRTKDDILAESARAV